jgi:hypothetical protein
MNEEFICSSPPLMVIQINMKKEIEKIVKRKRGRIATSFF